ncbi:ketoacyl-ACP synthase III [Siculibacillus lacustris]|uniref:Beta-ketoacyl-[acyl-carrier-protein] synthase III n=1 Tax=Siculibacillus lacustris TaxID=1549641 RepID=A0A4V2KU22_9HYPH|nr:ketoacyl-ACP synthase III [Siculibacillus lacustris]
MSVLRTVVRGVGSYLPRETLTNADLAKIVDTTDDWIVERSGIHERHRAAEGEFTSDLAVAAARAALENAGIDAADIDLVVVATATPDYTFPATAGEVQSQLGITRGFAYDLQAVCSGFVYALATADAQIKAGLATRAVVIGAETFSRILDWTDRTTCVLFGDGAGAVVIEAAEGGAGLADRGIIASHLRADGRHREKLFVDGGPSRTQTAGHLRMEGKEVFKHAVTNLAGVMDELLVTTGLTAADIDWFVPHQANRRIIEATGKRLGIDAGKIIMTLQVHGNTSAASIPLALDVGVKDGRIKPGDLVMIEAMGGGFTWGASLIRW